ncbi:hypothetical protein [Propionivibrio dicarboxylicus]|uniref:Uncharacterized protein n=1 Tax=Propionivibrio dicarboxylicus TaxID=83767 RepID=A0A1G8L9D7_9RHOO|nr:hypothetical protein [Propionivibrio dicarboxylicus]SDI52325.1 hypothetical protein SAMN05660652_03579 [Propionivibrio dicarboxylicus]
MSAVTAVLYDFVSARERSRHLEKVKSADALKRIERCDAWLNKNGVEVIGFRQPLFGMPYVIVGARPAVFSLFSGRKEFKGHRQDGALRYKVWEGIDRVNNVSVRWVEVVACA